MVEDTPSATAQLAALQGGVESGQELASNGELLDENVLALASGAADLVNGILQLNDGAAELSDGLVNTAAPGSAELRGGERTSWRRVSTTPPSPGHSNLQPGRVSLLQA